MEAWHEETEEGQEAERNQDAVGQEVGERLDFLAKGPFRYFLQNGLWFPKLD